LLESTDVANLATSLRFVRYINEDTGIAEEELLFFRPLKERTTGDDTFNLTNAYFPENEMDLSRCIGICTDGATSMTGKHAGFVAWTKEVATNVSWTRCYIHRQALASKRIPQGLKEVIDNAVKIENFIKSLPTNSRIFQALCEEMGRLHNCLLTHAEVRRLLRGKIIVRLFELRAEIVVVFIKEPFHLARCAENHVWLQSLAYLADIFSRINELNMSLQGLDIAIVSVRQN
jgi:hypothetical protein